MRPRCAVATIAGRACAWALHHVLHRSGSQLPGRVALRIDPTLVRDLTAGRLEGSVVVCGTNGKTTTTNLVARALEQAGVTVACNREGANMLAGVASALVARPRARHAVLEVDELSTIHVLPALRPTHLVLINLFRDQLDRAGEIDHVQDTIVAALAASPETTLVVCADDPLSVAVAVRAREAGTPVLSFGIDEDLHLPADRVPEGRFCPRCGALLAYAHHTYAQLGSFSCPACGFARPDLDFAATGVSVTPAGVAFDLATRAGVSGRVEAGFGGTYMVYNLLAAVAAATLAGATLACAQRAIASFHPDNGRLQRFRVGGRDVMLNLAKNPTGLNQNISLALADERPKALFVVVNDNPNDGRDVSWIWDVDFERLLATPTIKAVLAGGTRAHDVQVRLKYAGISARIAPDVGAALDEVDDTPTDVVLYVLVNYSALAPARDELARLEAAHGR